MDALLCPKVTNAIYIVGQVNLGVEFKSRFLRPAEAMLILVGHRIGSASGNTMVFKLVSQVDGVQPIVSIATRFGQCS